MRRVDAVADGHCRVEPCLAPAAKSVGAARRAAVRAATAVRATATASACSRPHCATEGPRGAEVSGILTQAELMPRRRRSSRPERPDVGTTRRSSSQSSLRQPRVKVSGGLSLIPADPHLPRAAEARERGSTRTRKHENAEARERGSTRTRTWSALRATPEDIQLGLAAAVVRVPRSLVSHVVGWPDSSTGCT